MFGAVLDYTLDFLVFKNHRFKKVAEFTFFQRGQSGVLVTNLKFFLFFVVTKIGREMVFSDCFKGFIA